MPLSYVTFIMLSYAPSVPNLLRDFFCHKFGILSNAFSEYIEIIIRFFSLILIR